MGRATAVFVNPLFSEKIALKWRKSIFKPVLSLFTLKTSKSIFHLIYAVFVMSAVCLQFSRFIAIKKIRPFFKSARQADSEYAKKFLKVYFLMKFCLENP